MSVFLFFFLYHPLVPPTKYLTVSHIWLHPPAAYLVFVHIWASQTSCSFILSTFSLWKIFFSFILIEDVKDLLTGVTVQVCPTFETFCKRDDSVGICSTGLWTRRVFRFMRRTLSATPERYGALTTQRCRNTWRWVFVTGLCLFTSSQTSGSQTSGSQTSGSQTSGSGFCMTDQPVS